VRWNKSFSLALLLLRGISATSARAELEQPFHPWRCPANGGINALYCYLRINGVSCPYSELLREQEEQKGTRVHTAATLVQIAARKGLPLQSVSLTMDELLSCSLPVIIHMDGESPEAGAFMLVFAASDYAVDYVNGPSTEIHEMDREDFRRVWSGIALVPKTDPRHYAVCGVIGISIGLSLPMAFRFARRLSSA